MKVSHLTTFNLVSNFRSLQVNIEYKTMVGIPIWLRPEGGSFCKQWNFSSHQLLSLLTHVRYVSGISHFDFGWISTSQLFYIL